MKEYGRIGQNRWDGTFYEEFLPELRGKRGILTYREMERNDDIVGAFMFTIKMLIRNATWNVEPGGTSAKDREAADFVQECMGDMQATWTDTISEILSFLVYGWSFHEIVYKRRIGRTRNRNTSSKYSDGRIGWQKLPIRSQDTLYKWEYDDKDNIIGMTQQPPPDFELLTIPIKKALLFRTESAKDNPEGRSILRNAYRPWYFKRRIQEIEAIGIERDLAGLPVITVPEGLEIWDDQDAEAQKIYSELIKMVKGLRRNEREGLVLPYGYTVQLLSTGGTRQFDTNALIDRYDSRILMTVTADFLMLGHAQTGSFALSENKTGMFSIAIGAFLDIICETFNNQGIPSLIDINGEHFAGITDYPKMTHGEVDDVDLEAMSDYLSKLTGLGIIVPDEELEDYVRSIANLPERTKEDNDRSVDPLREAMRRKQVEPADGPAQGEEEDEEAAEEAKKRLGRK